MSVMESVRQMQLIAKVLDARVNKQEGKCAICDDIIMPFEPVGLIEHDGQLQVTCEVCVYRSHPETHDPDCHLNGCEACR